MRADISDLLRAARRRKRWTQADLAQVSGVGRGDISRIENTGVVTDVMLARLLLALGQNVEAVFVAVGRGRQAAVYALDTLQRQATESDDPVALIEAALLQGGWAKPVYRALAALAEATRPRATA